IQLRLAGEKRKHNEGRVEVYYDGQWGTVCDDDFNHHAAQVVCRELGYASAISVLPSAKYGKGEGRIWFDNVHCTGKESTLAQCGSNGIGVSDCKHSEDVGVVCSDKRIPGFRFLNSVTNNIDNTITPSDHPLIFNSPNVQLLFTIIPNGLSQVIVYLGLVHLHPFFLSTFFLSFLHLTIPLQILVEFVVFNKYCEQIILIISNATVRLSNTSRFFCSLPITEFGLLFLQYSHFSGESEAARANEHPPDAHTHTHASTHTSPSAETSHMCLGNLVRFFPPVFMFSFQHLTIQVEDARIKPILASYRKRIPVTEGYVEVKDGGKWKQICDEEWTPMNSRVICGMFGFPAEKKYNARVYKSVMFARRKPPSYWDFSVNCTGNEAHLSSCNLGRSMLTNNTCRQGIPVVVSCVPGRAFAPTPLSGYRKAFRHEPLVRLKGGAVVGEGRVEVLKNGEWGTICDDRWNLVAATVVCRELGFGTAKEALSGGQLGQGMGPVHMNEVQCTGFEKSVTECVFIVDKDSEGCNHEEDAGVRCNVPAMGFQQRLRLSGGRNPFEGRVEVLMERNGSLVWGTVCGERWSTMEAMVVCRQLGLGYASHAFQETWHWPGLVSADGVVMSGVRCAGTEMSLSHCLHHGEHVNCPRGGARYSAGVTCSETAPDLVLNPQVVEQTTYIEDRPMFMLQCAYEENCLASTSSSTPANSYRRLLRFSSQIHNNGQSDFKPKASRETWVWHDCHRHYHSMEVFTYYDLLSLNGSKVAEGHKASFCLEDSECDEGIEKKYECANFGEQGITVGCWDTYRHDIDCQWVDITDVKPGDYMFQIVINPNYEVAESDYTNNIVKCRTRYDGHRIWMYNCHIGE
ncbi:lysyl oxidase-like 2 precursor, partial [Silurus asotus]